VGTNKNDVSTNSKNIAKNYFFLVMLKDLVLDSRDENGTDIFRPYSRPNSFRGVLIRPYSSPDI
jgi:hypothetical protein